MTAGKLVIETDVSADEMRPMLEKWQPWRHDIAFTNGLKTTDFETTTPFTNDPLNKVRALEAHIPMEDLRGGYALDIGFNAGYNSIYLAQTYGMSVTGIDVWTRHQDVATYFASNLKQGSCEFLIDDATTFSRPDSFNLILHFGTLYHLPNPLLSLENTVKNLKSGGWLGLETTCYNGEDGSLCKFVRGFNGDVTNYWALSKPVLEEMLEVYGMTDIVLAIESDMPIFKGEMSRVLYVARKQ